MQAQHGGHEEEGKDALGLAGRLSEQSPSRDCMFPICLPLPVSLSVSFPATRWSAMKQDGDGDR